MNYFTEPLNQKLITEQLSSHIVTQQAKIASIVEVTDHLATYKPEQLNARVASHFDGLAGYQTPDEPTKRYSLKTWHEGTSRHISQISWRTSDWEWAKGTDGKTKGIFSIYIKADRNEKIELTLEARTKTELLTELQKAKLYAETQIENALKDLANISDIADYYGRAIEALQNADKLIKSHITRNFIK